MKIKKYNENKEYSENEISELFKQLKYHDTMHKKIDNELADICMSKIKHLLDNGRAEEAKEIWRNFYKPCLKQNSEGDTDDFSFEKDMILMKINSVLKKQRDAKKYNL